MENGKRYEQYYSAKLNALEYKQLEQLGDELREKLQAEADDEFGRAFEAPKKFDNEDEKNRYAEFSQQANEIRDQLNDISQQISQATHQLASLPLTVDQQRLLDEINRLVTTRGHATDPTHVAQLDVAIEAAAKQLADLPTTPEQGALLDDILALIEQRDETKLQLRSLIKTHRSGS